MREYEEKKLVKFYRQEQCCESAFHKAGPLWHLFTPGHTSEIIFTNDEEFAFGMNMIACCFGKSSSLKLYTFTLMNNHLHIILSGPEDECKNAFSIYRRRLLYFFSRNKKRSIDFSGFQANLLPIGTLTGVRNEIVYVNRNGYVVHRNHTPYSYFWGCGNYFYNPLHKKVRLVKLSSFSVLKKRELLSVRETTLDDNLLFFPMNFRKGRWTSEQDTDDSSEKNSEAGIKSGGIIWPSSFCEIEEAERFFRDAHQYFNLLSKNYEAYSEIAKRLGETVILTDEELYSVTISLCQKKFGSQKISSLNPQDRMALAKMLHSEYNATNRQLQRILKIDPRIIRELYPEAR